MLKLSLHLRPEDGTQAPVKNLQDWALNVVELRISIKKAD